MNWNVPTVGFEMHSSIQEHITIKTTPARPSEMCNVVALLHLSQYCEGNGHCLSLLDAAYVTKLFEPVQAVQDKSRL
jgi:hypothetical protein